MQKNTVKMRSLVCIFFFNLEEYSGRKPASISAYFCFGMCAL